jgi:crotonobetainyl-CoA:carnitine CoA-transferase CaiB-like acyl-CoA transferase
MGLLYNSSTFARLDGTGPERHHLDAAQTGLSALYRLYETADGWLCVAVTSDAHWNALAACVGGRVLGDPRFTDAASRAKHDEELGRLLERHCLSPGGQVVHGPRRLRGAM